jgi:L-alanine-DL-glutamate epimerase-like enolase superfamily enzyme
VGSYSEAEGFCLSSSPEAAAEFEANKMVFIRSHVGKEIKVMLDGHMSNSPEGTWDLGVAEAVLRSVEPFDLFFFEEPLPYIDPWGYSELCKRTHIPIAGGECLTAAYERRVFVERDCFDIGQPDASFTGGLAEFTKVAAMLEARGRKIATHSWGAGGSFMQNLHCGFACSNTAILEIAPAFGPLHSEIIDGSFAMEDGMALPPSKAGLGIKLTDDIKTRYPFVSGSGEFNSVPGKVLAD